MRKIKKINGYLVVRFNDREKREYEGTALGDYGVIDAELYTGNLDIDRSVMEYDNADSLEIAVELARGLESEEDITDEPPTYTIVTETDDTFTEEEVEPKLMVTNWETQLKHQIQSESYPDMNARTAAHELHGFKLALYRLGLLDRDELEAVEDYFTSISSAGRSGFVHVSETIQSDPMTQRVYDLGVALTRDCPQNDCKIFLNIFNMARELDDAIEGMGDYPATILRGALRDRIFEMREMYRRNHAVKEYRDTACDRPTPNDEDPASKEVKQLRHFRALLDDIDKSVSDGPYHPGKSGPSPYAAGHMGGGEEE